MKTSLITQAFSGLKPEDIILGKGGFGPTQPVTTLPQGFVEVDLYLDAPVRRAFQNPGQFRLSIAKKRSELVRVLGDVREDVFENWTKLTRQRLSSVLARKFGYKLARASTIRDVSDTLVGLSLTSVNRRRHIGVCHWRVIAPSIQDKGLINRLHLADVAMLRGEGVHEFYSITETERGKRSMKGMGFEPVEGGQKNEVRLVL